jgi:ABC-type sugar transport system ATPase subunit
MNDGVIEQIGAPSEIYRWPETVFVAGFFGSPSMNLIECEAIAETATLKVKFGGDDYTFRIAADERPVDIGPRVFLGFRPEDIALGAPPGGESLVGRARIASVEAMGAETLIYMKAEGFSPVARILRHAVPKHAAPKHAAPKHAEVEPGSEVEFGVAPEYLHFFRADSGRRIRMEWDE